MYMYIYNEVERDKNVTGSGVGMLALGSPILAHAITPPLMTISGFAPKKDGFQSTRSASLPTCRGRTRVEKLEKPH